MYKIYQTVVERPATQKKCTSNGKMKIRNDRSVFLESRRIDPGNCPSLGLSENGANFGSLEVILNWTLKLDAQQVNTFHSRFSVRKKIIYMK